MVFMNQDARLDASMHHHSSIVCPTVHPFIALLLRLSVRLLNDQGLIFSFEIATSYPRSRNYFYLIIIVLRAN